MRWNVSSLPNGDALAAYLPKFFSLQAGVVMQSTTREEPGYAATTDKDGVIEIEYNGLADLMIALGDLLADGPPTETREHLGQPVSGLPAGLRLAGRRPDRRRA